MYKLSEIRIWRATPLWINAGLGDKINFIFTDTTTGDKESRTVYSNIDPCYKVMECLVGITFRHKKPLIIEYKTYTIPDHPPTPRYYSRTKYIYKKSEVK